MDIVKKPNSTSTRSNYYDRPAAMLAELAIMFFAAVVYLFLL